MYDAVRFLSTKVLGLSQLQTVVESIIFGPLLMIHLCFFRCRAQVVRLTYTARRRSDLQSLCTVKVVYRT